MTFFDLIRFENISLSSQTVNIQVNVLTMSLIWSMVWILTKYNHLNLDQKSYILRRGHQDIWNARLRECVHLKKLNFCNFSLGFFILPSCLIPDYTSNQIEINKNRLITDLTNINIPISEILETSVFFV